VITTVLEAELTEIVDGTVPVTAGAGPVVVAVAVAVVVVVAVVAAGRLVTGAVVTGRVVTALVVVVVSAPRACRPTSVADAAPTSPSAASETVRRTRRSTGESR
jgi:hypothetical protein